MDELSAGVLTILNGSLDALKPSPEDRKNLILYAEGAVKALYRAKTTTDNALRASALKEARAYQDAIELVVARYEVKVGSEAEKAMSRALNLALSTFVKIGIAALST